MKKVIVKGYLYEVTNYKGETSYQNWPIANLAASDKNYQLIMPLNFEVMAPELGDLTEIVQFANEVNAQPLGRAGEMIYER